MSRSTLAAGLRHLRGALAVACRSDESDEQLLHAFTAQRDESAFAVLVRRHGPMVFQVCRRVLGNEQDAEDAFQAAFLLLAQKAAGLRKKTSLASFLHGAAWRIALAAKRAAARRRKREGSLGALMQPRSPAEPSDEVSWREVRALLHEEIALLPEKYQTAFVLCVLEDLSQTEAARRLGLKERTLSSRLAAARKRLARRLARRGVELTAVLAAATLGAQPASALPAGLIAKTIQAATAAAAGEGLAGIVSASIAEMVQSATAAMMVSKAKIAVVVLLAASLLTVATSGSLVFLNGRPSRPRAAAPADPPRALAADKPQPATPARQSRERVEVGGRVVDPDGKPVAGAKVVLHQRRPNTELPDFFPAPSIGTTDANGRFHFSANVHRNAPGRDYSPMLTLTAHVPGYGPAAISTESPEELKERTLRLVKDDVPIHGRILNTEGRPVPGVIVRPVAVVATAAGDLGRLIDAVETNKNTWSDLSSDFRPSIVFSAAASGLTQTAKTDGEGKFTLSRFGRERIVVLRLDGPGIETCLLNAMTRMGPTVRANRPRSGGSVFGAPMVPGRPRRLHEPPPSYVYTHGDPFDFAAGPELVVKGAVRDQETDKPIAGVVVRHQVAYKGEFGYSFPWAHEDLTTTSDADGNYRLAGLSRPTPQASQFLQFIPPRDQPCPSAGAAVPAPEFGKPVKLDVRLKRGVWINGRVTDKATGQPVQASVNYFAFADNPELRGIKGFGSQVVSSKKDGSFVLAALRGRGIVAVRTDEMRWGMYLHGQGASAISGPRDERISRFDTRPYMGPDWSYDTLVGIEADAKAESVTCDVQLDPGKTVKGTILDPDGKPLAGAGIRGPFLSLFSLPDLPTATFTVPAVNPHKPEAFFFEHQKRKLAAAVILKGDEAEGFIAKLQPTGTITGRILNEKGEPLRKAFIQVDLKAGQLNLTRDYNGFSWGQAGADGRFKLEGLLPGVKLGSNAKLFADLTLQPGEVRDLGDIRVQTNPIPYPSP